MCIITSLLNTRRADWEHVVCNRMETRWCFLCLNRRSVCVTAVSCARASRAACFTQARLSSLHQRLQNFQLSRLWDKTLLFNRRTEEEWNKTRRKRVRKETGRRKEFGVLAWDVSTFFHLCIAHALYVTLLLNRYITKPCRLYEKQVQDTCNCRSFNQWFLDSNANSFHKINISSIASWIIN